MHMNEDTQQVITGPSVLAGRYENQSCISPSLYCHVVDGLHVHDEPEFALVMICDQLSRRSRGLLAMWKAGREVLAASDDAMSTMVNVAVTRVAELAHDGGELVDSAKRGDDIDVEALLRVMRGAATSWLALPILPATGSRAPESAWTWDVYMTARRLIEEYGRPELARLAIRVCMESIQAAEVASAADATRSGAHRVQ